MNESTRTLRLALVVELGLGLVAVGVGWLAGHSPGIGMSLSPDHVSGQLRFIGLGVVATVPLAIALLLIDQLPFAPLERVREMATDLLRRMFPKARIWQLALIAAAAGLGEELLFRGLLQAGLARLIGDPAGPWIALVVASLVFGAFHWLDITYALLASLAGLYFGWLLLVTDSLWPPIIAHGLYDFVALCYVTRAAKAVE